MDAIMYTLVGFAKALWWGPLFPLAVAAHGARLLARDPTLEVPDLDVLFLVPIVGGMIWTVAFTGALTIGGVL